MKKLIAILVITLLLLAGQATSMPTGGTVLAQKGGGGDGLLTFHHYVSHISTIPAIEGEPTQLYVREKVQDRADLGSTPGRGEVVLMVHGATSPSVPAFDLSYQDYSWMGSLAEAGFDVFAMDHIGFGWSTRPWPMDDPCNARPEDQEALLVPSPLDTPCPPSYPFLLTNASTAADEIDQVVEYLRSLRQVERIHLIGYSAGGARFGSYAALHPEKVDKLILLAPAYPSPANAPVAIPAPGFSLLVGRADLPLLPLPAQCGAGIEPGLLPVFRAALEEFDPIGATWGAGVLRAPTYQPGGWNATRAAQVQAPTLLMSGEFDSGVPQAGVRQLYNDLGSDQKVFVDIACSQHTVPLETRRNIVHEASLEWLLQGSVHGLESGTLRLGD